MSFWLTALVVWLAAGARVGRVVVRPATTVRTAIVLAVSAVAIASTLAIPDVAGTVDTLLPGGVGGGAQLSAAGAAAAWLGFAIATSVVAFAAWPIASRRSLRNTAVRTYSVGLLVGISVFVWSAVPAWCLVVLGSVFVVVTGVRNLDWTPLGRGIALYVLGTALVASLALLQLYREVTEHDGVAQRTTPASVWSVASVFIAVGAVWIVVEVWIRSRLLLRRVTRLHADLVRRFPEVLAEDPKHTTTVLQASDRVAQIMDALYLQSGGGVATGELRTPPRSVVERAAGVARWARDPLTDLTVDARWIAPPDGMSARRWVAEIARAYSTD